MDEEGWKETQVGIPNAIRQLTEAAPLEVAPFTK
jgi:hypothetical protein